MLLDFPFFLSSAIKPAPVLNCLLCPPSLCSCPPKSLYMSFSLYYPWSGHYEYEERCTWHFSGYFIERPKVDFTLVRLPSGQNRFERAFQFTNDSKMPVANSLLPATGCVCGARRQAQRATKLIAMATILIQFHYESQRCFSHSCAKSVAQPHPRPISLSLTLSLFVALTIELMFLVASEKLMKRTVATRGLIAPQRRCRAATWRRKTNMRITLDKPKMWCPFKLYNFANL